MVIKLLIIDGQNDFCDPKGSLYVPGADASMRRLTAMIRRIWKKLSDIKFTMDSHRRVDISHPIWYVDSAGNPPPPFTVITAADLKSGRWNVRYAPFYARTLAYLEALEATGRYPHVIWPPHCLIGSWGHAIWPDLLAAAHEWEEKRFALAEFVTKGSNIWTEHFSAARAEVPDPQDPSTQINVDLIEDLEKADQIVIAGEALSHCVANTVRDVIAQFKNPDSAKKIVILLDATDPVGDPPGTTMFTDMANKFVQDMRALGVQFSTTIDYLA